MKIGQIFHQCGLIAIVLLAEGSMPPFAPRPANMRQPGAPSLDHSQSISFVPSRVVVSDRAALASETEVPPRLGLNADYFATLPIQRGMGIAGDIFLHKNVPLRPNAMTRVFTYAQPVAVPQVKNGRTGASWCFSLSTGLLFQMPTTIRGKFTLAVILNVSDQNRIYGSNGSTVETDMSVTPADAGSYKQIITDFDNDNLPARDPLLITVSAWNSSTDSVPIVRWSGVSPEMAYASNLRVAMWNN